WNLASAGATTERAMAERIFAEVGRKPKLLVANKLMLRALGLFDPLMREVVEMHYLWTSPVLLDDSALGELLGSLAKTSYAEGIKNTLAAMRADSAGNETDRSAVTVS